MGGIVTSQVNNEKNAIKFLNTGLQQLEGQSCAANAMIWLTCF